MRETEGVEGVRAERRCEEEEEVVERRHEGRAGVRDGKGSGTKRRAGVVGSWGGGVGGRRRGVRESKHWCACFVQPPALHQFHLIDS